MKKQLVWATIVSYITIFVNIISGLIVTPWMIFELGEDQYALFTIATSIVSFFVIDFGIGGSIAKFISNFYAKKEREKANNFLGGVYKAYLVIDGGILLILLVVSLCLSRIYSNFGEQNIVIIKQLFVILSAYSILTFPFLSLNGILLANEKYVFIKLSGLAQKIVNVLVIIFTVVLTHNIIYTVLFQSLSGLIFIGVKLIWLKKTTDVRVILKGNHIEDIKVLIGFSIWVTVMNISSRFIYSIMPTLIGKIVDSGAVALFGLAASIEGYAYTFADAINGLFMPQISVMFVEKNDNQFNSLLVKVGKYHVFTLGLLYTGFLCIGREFVKLWVGGSYGDIYPCVLLVILPMLIDAPQQVARTAMLVVDAAKQQAIAYALMAICNISISIPLIKHMGVIGAAVSIAVSYFVRTIVSNVVYKRYLPVKLFDYFKQVYFPWIFIAIGTVVIFFGISKKILGEGVVHLLCQGVLVVAFYVTLTLLLDKEFGRDLLKKVLRRQ